MSPRIQYISRQMQLVIPASVRVGAQRVTLVLRQQTYGRCEPQEW